MVVDVECDPKRLDQVLQMLNREVHSVNFTSVDKSSMVRAPSLSACSSFGRNFHSTVVYILHSCIILFLSCVIRFWRYDVVSTKNCRFG